MTSHLEDLENAKSQVTKASTLEAAQNGILIAIGEISSFKFVPVPSDDNILLAIKVFYNNETTEAGIFEFNGNNLQTPIKVYSGNTSVRVHNFHYVGSSIEHSSISSLQSSGTSGYIFQRSSGAVNFNSIKFYHPFTKNLLGTINSGKPEEFFKFNLSIGTT